MTEQSERLTEAQKDSRLKAQIAGWPNAVEAGRKGNPFATLCQHCYGRHAPPNDDICPYQSPKPALKSSGGE